MTEGGELIDFYDGRELIVNEADRLISPELEWLNKQPSREQNVVVGSRKTCIYQLK